MPKIFSMFQIWGLCGTDSPWCWPRCIRVWPQSPDPGVPTVRSIPNRSLGPQTAAARIHWSFKCSIENGRNLEHLFLHSAHIFWIYICYLIKSIVPSFLLYLQLGVSFPWQELVTSASKRSIRRFVITEKAPTRAFSWLKAATTAFTFKTLLTHSQP